jgi:hypothetical protein
MIILFKTEEPKKVQEKNVWGWMRFAWKKNVVIQKRRIRGHDAN